jgi:hypothetical protein
MPTHTGRLQKASIEVRKDIPVKSADRLKKFKSLAILITTRL